MAEFLVEESGMPFPTGPQAPGSTGVAVVTAFMVMKLLISRAD